MSEHLVISRRGIVHVVRTLDDNASTACGKGSRDLVLIGAVGIGERMCHVCSLRLAATPPTPDQPAQGASDDTTER